MQMLNWGIMGAGGIARVFCNALRFSKTGQAAAVASQTPDKLHALADDFSIPKRYSSYEALLQDPNIDVLYIATIHPLHAEWAIKAAEAGKHLLVEKPIGMNHAEAATMIDAAAQHDVFLMEAFMYRCHPQTQKLVELVRDGAIGDVRIIRAVFSYYTPYTPSSRAYNKALGGSGILDVGCYPASMARLIAGAAAGRPFLDPVQVKACGKVSSGGVDLYTAATVQFDNDIVAELITGVACPMPVEVSIYGEAGRLAIANPWLPSSPCRTAKQPLPPDTLFPPTTIELTPRGSQTAQQILVTPDRDLFTYEADMVAAHIAERQAPAMRWDDTLGNMRLLDRWRREIGAA
jgi:predicted dehydrogenase